MIDDPVVEEVYRARQSLIDKFGGDAIAWLRNLRAQQHRHGERLVTLQEVRARRKADGKAAATNRSVAQ